FFNNVVIQGRMGEVEAAVLDGEMSESQAVEELIGVFDKSIKWVDSYIPIW
ncbi:LAO/AO transport system ATPase, partial [human gut metagenome]